MTMIVGWTTSVIAGAVLTYISEQQGGSNIIAINVDPYRRRATRLHKLRMKNLALHSVITPSLRMFSTLVLVSVAVCVLVLMYSYCSVYRSGRGLGWGKDGLGCSAVGGRSTARVAPISPEDEVTSYDGSCRNSHLQASTSTSSPSERRTTSVQHPQPIYHNPSDNTIVYRPGENIPFSADDILALEMPRLVNGASGRTPTACLGRNNGRSGGVLIGCNNLQQLSAANTLRFSDLRWASRQVDCHEVNSRRELTRRGTWNGVGVTNDQHTTAGDNNNNNGLATRGFAWRESTAATTHGAWSKNGATRNGVVMLAVFAMCSLPLFVSCMPGVLPRDTERDNARRAWLVFCRVLFHFNALLFPLWYLLFSARVKRNFTKQYSSLVKFIRNRLP